MSKYVSPVLPAFVMVICLSSVANASNCWVVVEGESCADRYGEWTARSGTCENTLCEQVGGDFVCTYNISNWNVTEGLWNSKGQYAENAQEDDPGRDDVNFNYQACFGTTYCELECVFKVGIGFACDKDYLDVYDVEFDTLTGDPCIGEEF